MSITVHHQEAALTAAAHCPAADGEATPGGGASLGGRLIEQGYVPARFGGMPVLVGPKLAAQLKALRESHG
jgi:hypothetical protein